MRNIPEDVFIMSVMAGVQDNELNIPPPDQPYECPVCGIDLEQEDFLLAQQRGWS